MTTANDSGGPLLELSDVSVHIDEFEIVTGVDMTVNEGETVALVGRNGAGKTTTFRGIMGMDDVRQGTITFRGSDITGLPTDRIAGKGIGYQPEDRQLFEGLTVDENLRVPIWTSDEDVDEQAVVDDVYDLFPDLAGRKDADVANLSGGQGKMAAIGRALALQPSLLILDEPLEGLAPVVVQELTERLEAIKERDISVLLAEANGNQIRKLVDRMYVIDRGQVVAEGEPGELLERERIQNLMQGSETA